MTPRPPGRPRIRPRPGCLLALWLLFLFAPFAQAGEGLHRVLLLLSADTPPYRELAMALNASFGAVERRQLDLRVHTVGEAPLPSHNDLVVTAGVRALRQILERPDTTPLLAAFLPEASYRRLQPGGRRPASALFIDQPPSRYLDLVRALLPRARHIGLIASPYSQPLLPTLRRAATRRHLVLRIEHLDAERELARVIRRLFPRSDALLALADPGVYNRRTLKNLLLASYRQGLPVIGYSRSLVRAGALAAVYTTPSQLGLQLAETLTAWMRAPDHGLPPPRHPEYFVVDVNRPLARALGLAIPHESILMDRITRFEKDERG